MCIHLVVWGSGGVGEVCKINILNPSLHVKRVREQVLDSQFASALCFFSQAKEEELPSLRLAVGPEGRRKASVLCLTELGVFRL